MIFLPFHKNQSNNSTFVPAEREQLGERHAPSCLSFWGKRKKVSDLVAKEDSLYDISVFALRWYQIASRDVL